MLKVADRTLLHEAALIDGEWFAAGSNAFPVDDPASGDPLGSVPACGKAETQRAIEAAKAAWPAWRSLTAHYRAALLETWHRLVLENAEDLARIMTAEQGKPIAEAAGEIRYAASFIKWFAEEGRRIGARNVASPETDRRILVLTEPVGISAAITPWNFPAAMITRKCAPALAAGCPVIVKPSEMTPFTALALADLALRAGIPSGVFHVLTGIPQEIGETITSSPDVRKLSFTGSTRVGSLLMRQCADTIKRLSLELGGNAPLIVFDDADLELAANAAMASKFRNAGQTCVCANRILVHSAVFEDFAELLGKRVAALVVAPGDDPDATVGPLINDAAVEKVHAHVADALDRGGKVIARGSGREDARFVRPLVIADAHRDMRLANEETFGPVAPLFRFETEEEAIVLANDTPYGLASYFYTRDLSRSFRVAEALEAGMVALNTGSISMEMAPFGGMKQSGLGREGGTMGIEEYLEVKAFHIGGLNS
ncbi:NAD-dependent succinate-semialdehyde dehydrogenase [Novosphingobium marinum]|uniref:Succinate-semialdehyde dehydrogenase/glutarate-semialdehyde dehydrogenase n=1 Tax=Novosphingobium marinum TaxID=1514948 RepID=A0A7Y9XYU1_9SPHN|nr:NAD-dependent succinate-semialdehyde dehydrogenase [Novosphingobium marinum]NYH97119.1 succinate-semialdehyde dehydrogenase/glutarate-semialdehyde dehydrogenase [Novosphingobium marinum]GGC43616.1 NAD-dependent succinate-semialdehyde dehydrogenase [Novosphingobium marinum]